MVPLIAAGAVAVIAIIGGGAWFVLRPAPVATIAPSPPAFVVRSAGEAEIALGPTEFKMLHFFMTHPERVYTRMQVLDHVWGDHVFVEERTVDVHIRRLRQALEPTGHDSLIETVRGTGYRFRG